MYVPPIKEDKNKAPVGDEYKVNNQLLVHNEYKVDDSHDVEVICYFQHFNYFKNNDVGFNKLHINFFLVSSHRQKQSFLMIMLFVE